MPIWNPEYETMDRAALQELQLRRLKSTVAWAYERVPFYRQAFIERGIKPKDIRSLADLRLLPLTDKSTLHATYPFGLFAVPMEQVVRVHSSSGTTGTPIVVGYTRGDLSTWTELTARVASAAGITAVDRVQIAFPYGMFTGGWGMHYGIERIGATVFPAGPGNTERQILMMQDFGTTALVCTPSYALHIAEMAEDAGIDIARLSLRLGLFGGEPSGSGLRDAIEGRLGIRATDNYGLSEVMGPGVSGECELRDGLHIAEDHFLCEIIDPETGQSLPEGEEGELVITTLTKEAFPLLRYRTRDLTRIVTTPCPCGRTSARMEKVRQRTDDMLIIRGVNLYPSHIEDALLAIEGVTPHYLIIVDRERALDRLEVHIEVAADVFSDVMADMVSFIERVTNRIHAVTGLSAHVRLVEPGTIERTTGKAQHVIDRRTDR